MKLSSLFNLLTDSSDLLDFFEGVESLDQLTSRLEMLKRKGTKTMLACLDGLRSSVSDALDENLEISDHQEVSNEEDMVTDEELESLTADDEKANSESELPPEDEKNNDP